MSIIYKLNGNLSIVDIYNKYVSNIIITIILQYKKKRGMNINV